MAVQGRIAIVRGRDNVIDDDDSVAMLLELMIGDDWLDWLDLGLKRPKCRCCRW